LKRDRFSKFFPLTSILEQQLTIFSNDKGEKWFKTHGSDDVGGLGNSYPVAARGLAELWQKGKQPEGALKPWQNAENLAGAALGKSLFPRYVKYRWLMSGIEQYMTKRCKDDADTDIGEIKL